MNYLIERLKNGAIYIPITLFCAFLGYKLFLAPTTKNDSLYTAPTTNYSSVGTWNPAPGSCASIKIQARNK